MLIRILLLDKMHTLHISMYIYVYWLYDVQMYIMVIYKKTFLKWMYLKRNTPLSFDC